MIDPRILPEIPCRAKDLPSEIYCRLPDTFDRVFWHAVDAKAVAADVVNSFTSTLSHDDGDGLAKVFCEPDISGTYWRDSLALTSHLRTFSDRGRIVAALLQLCKRRGVIFGEMMDQGMVLQSGKCVGGVPFMYVPFELVVPG